MNDENKFCCSTTERESERMSERVTTDPHTTPSHPTNFLSPFRVALWIVAVVLIEIVVVVAVPH